MNWLGRIGYSPKWYYHCCFGDVVVDNAAPKRTRPSTLVVDLKDLKGPWSEWCATRDLTPSEAVRRVLRRVLDGKPKSEFMPHPANFDSEGAVERRRLEIRLTVAEHMALAAVADREGMSLPRWLTGLVRLHLTGEQQFGEGEVEALARSSQVLLALGRNVNQIARNMNPRVDRDELTLAQIEYLSDLIKKHTEAVSAVLTANSQRWRR